MKTVKEYITEAIVKHNIKKVNSNSNKYNNINFVDLGLSSGTLWAECNLGANKPEEEGEYYAWGETETKETYNKKTYKFCSPNNLHITKYGARIDKLEELELEDDVAAVNSNNTIVIPTREQCEELRDETDLSFIENYNNTKISGFLFKSKKNKNSIFIACNNYISNTSKYYQRNHKKTFGLWTKTTGPAANTAYYFLGYFMEKSSLCREELYANGRNHEMRDLGLQIRPVKNK